MHDIGKSDRPIVPAKRPNKGVGGNHARRRARREGASGRGKSAHALQNLDSEPKWNCNRGWKGYATPFMRQYPRQEPGAVMPLAGICAGGAGQPASLPRTVTARRKGAKDSRCGFASWLLDRT